MHRGSFINNGANELILNSENSSEKVRWWEHYLVIVESGMVGTPYIMLKKKSLDSLGDKPAESLDGEIFLSVFMGRIYIKD